MSEIKDGGPAFPIPLQEGQSYQGHAPCDGMTLRDYFAAKAMQAIIAANNFDGPDYADGIAVDSYEMADAMLRAREPKEVV